MSPALHYSTYSNWSLATYPFFSSSKISPSRFNVELGILIYHLFFCHIVVIQKKCIFTSKIREIKPLIQIKANVKYMHNYEKFSFQMKNKENIFFRRWGFIQITYTTEQLLYILYCTILYIIQLYSFHTLVIATETFCNLLPCIYIYMECCRVLAKMLGVKENKKKFQK